MKECPKLVELGRRQFLGRGALAAAGAAAVTAVPSGAARAALPAARVDYPTSRLANIKDLKVNEPMPIHYPDMDSPGVLVKLGARVPGGAGPDGDLVAYSTLCPHKGYPLAYDAKDRTLNCPGHFSRFDCEKEGQQVWGHATQNLPMFRLTVDAKGDISAVGADELIYGRTRNVLQG
ncbi:arsenate reductase (azurin) small subunit [Azospirillum sp. RWY-5-1]|uniref:Arsenate reductase (Azurin) small subunit n=1 Tax=Azospirillum oleiclasticum TaxID=2735135 RepID=A0ABX2TFV0_9PROT|nr:arsenate reductase (azurin) small subunit [Azospirillum oleiclasticum]NYZ14823.1 arsenate reductase (azurin) small subunit [Azospirillum oleiclasticum]NYZ22191.1 arsenate reductase (azurin) small subunit [Azospirillum oleiclasticum]